MKVKNGNVRAESLTSQSYLYRLGYVWLNVLMIKDKHNTPLNPLRWSITDAVWIVYFILMASVLLVATVLLGWFKALAMKDVEPIKFDWGGRNGAEYSTDYVHQHVWYYDNGNIETN